MRYIYIYIYIEFAAICKDNARFERLVCLIIVLLQNKNNVYFRITKLCFICITTSFIKFI